MRLVIHFYTKLLVCGLLIFVFFLGGCAVKGNLKVARSINDPIFPVKSRTVYLKPFAQNRIKDASLYKLGSIEAYYRNEFQRFFQQSGIFGISGDRQLEVTGELLSWHAKGFASMVAEVQYEFRMPDGSVLMSETITSEGSEGGLWLINPPYCKVRAGQKCFVNNLEKLKQKLTENGPDRWAAYVSRAKSFPKPSTHTAEYEKMDKQKDIVSEKAKTEIKFGNFYGLIIGNADYRHLPDLKTAINDAEMISRVLEQKYEFKIQMLVNANRAEILNALTEYRTRLSPEDNFLIYYAGHGWLDKEADEGYWLPVDAERDVPTNWLSNSTITSFLKAIRAKHVLVVADSCYSGKLARGIKMRDRTFDYFERLVEKRSRTVMASGGLEEVSDRGGSGNHSVFAAALIDELKRNDGMMDTTLIFQNIRRPIILNSEQTPEYSDIRRAGHEGGDFVFISRDK